MSFYNVLLDLPTEQLRKIVLNRALDPTKLRQVKDKRQLAQFLSSELVRQDSMAFAVRACNRRQLRLVQTLVVLEPPQAIPWRLVMPSLSTTNAEVVSETLDSLADIGLAFRTGGTVFIPEQLRSVVPVSMSARYTLDKCLNAYDANTIKRLAGNHGYGASNKSQSVEDIKRILQDDFKLAKALSELSKEELDILNYLLNEQGYATPDEIVSQLMPKYREDFFRYDWQDRWKRGQSRNPIDTLLGKGLIYAVSYSYGYNLFLVIPGDLIPRLVDKKAPNLWNDKAPAPIISEVAPNYVTQHSSLIKDIVSMLGGFSVAELSRTNTGFVHKTGLKNIARTLLLPDEKYANFIYALCREARLILPSVRTGFYEVTKEGVAWLSKDFREQLTELYDVWKKSVFFGEMYEEAFQKSSAYRSQELTQNVRRAGLNLITLETGSGFVEIQSLLNTLDYTTPMLLQENSSHNIGFVAKSETFIQRLVEQCLYWLGVIELGWKIQPKPTTGESLPASRGRAAKKTSEAEPVEGKPEPVSYRLTETGKALVGYPNAEIPAGMPREEEFIIQANSEIFLPPYLSPAIHYPLTLFTEIPKNGASNIVVLSKDAIRKTLDRGLTIEDILKFLGAHSRTGIPQNVEYMIREVGGKHGHIHIGSSLMYLTTETPNLMKELLAKKEIQSVFVRTLSDTIAIMNAADPERLLSILRKSGYLPVSDDIEGNSRLTIPESKTTSASSQATVIAVEKTSSKLLANLLSLDSLVDWEKLKQEDEILEENQLAIETSKPDNAVQNQENIRFVMVHALKNKYSIEVCYIPKKNENEIIDVAELRNLHGSFATLYFPNERLTKTINLVNVKWVRKM